MSKRPDLVLFNKKRKIPLEINICPCGIKFYSQRSAKRKYCSLGCYKKTLTGRKNPNAVQAMRQASKGRSALWNRNPEKIEKQRRKLIGIRHPERSIKMKGKANPNWRGGFTSFRHQLHTSSTYKHWRGEAFKINGRECNLCGSTNDLQIDHIVPLKILLEENNITDMDSAINCSKLWDFNNTRTLCLECHKQTPTYLSKFFAYRKEYYATK